MRTANCHRHGAELHGTALDRRAGRSIRPERPALSVAAGARSGLLAGDGLTAPDDEALRRDVELAKALGFNGVRKHQKIEDPRYLYWADRLGLLVWEEMPSAYRFTTRSVERLTREWTGRDRARRSHPCIVAWVPFNESWGVPDLPDSPAQRHYVQALYHLTKTLDPTRPVIGNDGWESVATDIIGIHDYDDQPERIGRRYGIDEIESQLFKRERPGGRMLVCRRRTAVDASDRAYGVRRDRLRRSTDDIWGYSRTETLRRIGCSATAPCWKRCAVCPLWRASATPSSLIRTRKRTACCMPTARRKLP